MSHASDFITLVPLTRWGCLVTSAKHIKTPNVLMIHLCTVAYLIDPTVFTTQKMPIDVELHGELTTGMTVADLRAPALPDCHTQAAVTLNHRQVLGSGHSCDHDAFYINMLVVFECTSGFAWCA